ncbi:MAG: ATP-binding protein [candidate division Zixibacteria bacterium]|nr:ATP-binding protein [candidate division Zixibacteria bacterium]
MDRFYSIAVNLIFYTALIMLVVSAMYFFMGLLKRLFLNCIALLLIITPLFLKYGNFMDTATISQVTIIGLCIYPITLSLMVKHHYNQYRQASLIPIYVISSLSFFSFMLLPDQRNLIIYIMNILLNVYLIYLIFPGKHSPSSVLLMAAIFINFLYLSLTVLLLNEIHYVFSVGLMSISTSIILGYVLRNRISGLIRQFSAINKLNERLNRRINRLKQSNDTCRKIIIEKDMELYQMARHASLAEITTGIAHELSQPLTGIKGIAQNMIDDINAGEFENLQAVSELTRISGLVDKSSSIIDHIRNFSKKSIMSLKPIDLNRVILEAIDLIRLQLKKNNIDLVFMLDETIRKINGDRLSLEQLIINIIMNSRDAILQKSYDPVDHNGTIRVTTFNTDGGVSLVIQDNGSGISDDIIHKIWSPFFTTKRRDHGTGIGLSICSKILKDHGATVDIQSGPGGTQFSFLFPA